MECANHICKCVRPKIITSKDENEDDNDYDEQSDDAIIRSKAIIGKYLRSQRGKVPDMLKKYMQIIRTERTNPI